MSEVKLSGATTSPPTTPTPASMEYEVIAVETIHRTYGVKAKNPEQARQRLRRYFQDSEAVAPGIVTPQGNGERVRWQLRGEESKKK